MAGHEERALRDRQHDLIADDSGVKQRELGPAQNAHFPKT